MKELEEVGECGRCLRGSLGWVFFLGRESRD